MKKRYLCALFLLACVAFGANAAAAQEEPAVLQPEEVDVTVDSTELDTGNSSNSVSPSGKILDHIYLDTVDLSGMTVEEAEDAANQRMEEIRGYHIVLHMDDQSVAVTAKELGVSGANHDAVLAAAELGQTGNVIKRYKAKKDLEKEPMQIPMQYQVDTEAVRSALEQYCIPLNREVINYGLTHNQGAFQITGGQSGVALKVEDSIQTVENYLTEVWKDGIGNIELDVDITEPKGNTSFNSFFVGCIQCQRNVVEVFLKQFNCPFHQVFTIIFSRSDVQVKICCTCIQLLFCTFQNRFRITLIHCTTDYWGNTVNSFTNCNKFSHSIFSFYLLF